MIEMRFTAQLWEIIRVRGHLFRPPTASREAAKGAAVSGAGAAVYRTYGDTSAAALGLGQGWQGRARQELGGGDSLQQFLVG